MKKIILLAIIAIFSLQLCYAEDESTEDIDSYFAEPEQTQELKGYLEYNNNAEQKEQDSIELNPINATGINITRPKSLGSKSLLSTSKKPSFQPLGDKLEGNSKFAAQEYNIQQGSSSVSHQFGKFVVGTSYGSYLDSAQVNYSTSLFSKYEGKHYAITTGFSNSTNNNDENYDNGKFYIAPELKLTKRLSLLDVMKTDAMQLSKSNEVVLRYTPHFKKYADDVQFEVGTGQSFYDDNYTKSTVRFSTNFKL